MILVRVSLTCSFLQPGLCEQTFSGLSTPYPWQPEAQIQSDLSLLGSVKEKLFVIKERWCGHITKKLKVEVNLRHKVTPVNIPFDQIG